MSNTEKKINLTEMTDEEFDMWLKKTRASNIMERIKKLESTINLIKEKMIKSNSDSIEELEKKFDEEIEVRRARWQVLRDTVQTALLPYLVPINKKLGYNPKTDKFERIENLEASKKGILERMKINDKELSELKASSASHTGDNTLRVGEINMLSGHIKDIFGEIKELKEQYKELDKRLQLSVANRILLREALRIIVEDYYEGTFKESMLETLGGKKTGRKEDTVVNDTLQDEDPKPPSCKCGNILSKSGAPGFWICKDCKEAGFSKWEENLSEHKVGITMATGTVQEPEEVMPYANGQENPSEQDFDLGKFNELAFKLAMPPKEKEPTETLPVEPVYESSLPEYIRACIKSFMLDEVLVEKEDLINYNMRLEEIKTFIINQAYIQANLKISILIGMMRRRYLEES